MSTAALATLAVLMLVGGILLMLLGWWLIRRSRQQPPVLEPEVRAEVERHLRHGRRSEALMVVHNRLGVPLSQAERVVRDVERALA